MLDPETRYNQMLAGLRRRDFRFTPQRMALLRLIASSDRHPSAAQLYEQIRPQFPTMSLATVYKTLAMLCEMGEALEIPLPGDSHYDGNDPHPHPHLVCTRCHTIIDGSAPLDGSAIQRMAEEAGFEVTRAQLTLYGLCPACRKALVQ